MTFAAGYAIIVGVLMFGQWAFFLAAKQVPELKTEPVRISFHLAAEFLAAAALMTSGAGLLVQAAWALQLYPVAVGMLIYTVIVSPGYFAQKRAWPLVGMFAVLLILALISLMLFYDQA